MMKDRLASTRKIFISYKREEVAHAQRLRDCLTDLGYEVWWDRNIQCGEVWNEVLDQAVREAGCIIVLWSPQALQSRWVMHEASSAMERSIYTPARIENCTIDQPYSRFQATDLMDWKGDVMHPGVQRLVSRINKLLPPKKTFYQRAADWTRSNMTLIAGLTVALLSLSILMWQTYSTQQQIQSLDNLISEVTNLDSSFSKSSSTLLASMEGNSKRTDKISDNLNHTSSNLQEYVVNFDSFQAKMVERAKVNEGIAANLSATSNDLKRYVKDFHEFRNEVFECWIVYEIQFVSLNYSFDGRLPPAYDMDVVINDNPLEKVFTKAPGENRLNPSVADMPFYNYLKQKDIKSISIQFPNIDTIFGLGVREDFDMGKFRYQRELKTDTLTQVVSGTIKRLLPLEDLGYFGKRYQTFESFKGCTFYLTGPSEEVLPYIGDVVIYLIGRDKMKALKFHTADLGGEYWGRIKPNSISDGWSEFGISMTITDTLFRNSLFTQRQNVLLLK